MPQRRGRHRNQRRHADVAEKAGEVKGQLVEEELQEEGIPLGLVTRYRIRIGQVGQRGGEFAELAVPLAVPAPRHHLRAREMERFEVPQQNEPVQVRRSGLLDGRI